MINIAICDDERAERTYLTALVHKWAAARGVVTRLSDYESAKSFYLPAAMTKRLIFYYSTYIMKAILDIYKVKNI